MTKSNLTFPKTFDLLRLLLFPVRLCHKNSVDIKRSQTTLQCLC